MAVLARARRRLRQGLLGLAAFARPVDLAAAQAILTAEQMALFRRMRPGEQHHSLRVMRALQAQGHTHPDLLTAALLHDAGKSRYGLSLVERVLVVLVEWVAPGRARRWSEGDPHGWRRAFVIKVQHPDWSAEDMAAAGASALAVEIARRHQQPAGETRTEADRLVGLLRAADDDE
jgi:hypothetical protein